MKIVQALYTNANGWKFLSDKISLSDPLVIVFGNRLLLEDKTVFNSISEQFPYNHIVYGSTAGEIANEQVFDDSLSVIAIEFEKSNFIVKTDNIYDHDKNAAELGAALYAKLPKENLKHSILLAAGNFINGTALIAGLEKESKHEAPITGGLCGDDGRFERPVASYNSTPRDGEAVIIGIYSQELEVTYASFGGFQPFGSTRVATKAQDNILYEVDGQPALELYKKYLGDRTYQKMESLLNYPLNVTEPGKTEGVVRTVLNIDTDDNSIVLAGNCPQGSQVQLMMASAHGIVNGALEAAKYALSGRNKAPELALVVSCMGRKAIMGQRIEEEVEYVREALGEGPVMAGFYSYGEIAPFYNSVACEMHNQTMTLTLLSE